jgi:hypothetical protein
MSSGLLAFDRDCTQRQLVSAKCSTAPLKDRFRKRAVRCDVAAGSLHHGLVTSESPMPLHERTQTRIQSLDERLARLRAEKIRLIARTNQTARKRNTRRKILIGAAVLAAVEHEGVPSLRTKAELLRWLDARLTRPHDRTAFDLTSNEAAPPTGR